MDSREDELLVPRFEKGRINEWNTVDAVRMIRRIEYTEIIAR